MQKKVIILKQTLAGPQTFIGGLAGASVPATSTSAGDTYVIISDGTSQGEDWFIGDTAIYNGTSGSWTRIPGAIRGRFVTMPTATADSGLPGDFSADDDEIAMYVQGTGWVFAAAYQK